MFTPLARALIATQDIMPTFAYLGIIPCVVTLAGARVMTNPPSGYSPATPQTATLAKPSARPI